MSNTAIARREFRESITFADIPTAETTKRLRQIGFDYDRRTGQWFRKDVNGKVVDEQTVIDEFVG